MKHEESETEKIKLSGTTVSLEILGSRETGPERKQVLNVTKKCEIPFQEYVMSGSEGKFRVCGGGHQEYVPPRPGEGDDTGVGPRKPLLTFGHEQ